MRINLILIITIIMLILIAKVVGQLRATDYEIWVYNHSNCDLTILDTTYETMWNKDFLIEENEFQGGTFEIDANYTYDENYANGSDYGYIIEAFKGDDPH